MKAAFLPDRGVVKVSGEDARAFLDGLFTTNVELVTPGVGRFGALLTPQGKWLADFFVIADGERLLLDAEKEQVPMLVQRLTLLRVEACDEWCRGRCHNWPPQEQE